MPESFIEMLPKIVSEGKREVEQVMDRLSSPYKLGLQTNEYVLPAKAMGGFFDGNKQVKNLTDWVNRLIYGDNLMVIQWHYLQVMREVNCSQCAEKLTLFI
jgi:hypothetical protein